jgi:hypothetical protein
MTLDGDNPWQRQEFLVEHQLARGHVVLTGLGLGLLARDLEQLEGVREITVLEAHSDVIEIWHELCRVNGYQTKKIQILNGRAEDAKNIAHDCLFLDHWESHSEHVVVSEARALAGRSSAEVVWFWPGALYYMQWCQRQQREISAGTYHQWLDHVAIDKLPQEVPIQVLENQYRIYKEADYEGYRSMLANWSKAPLLE